MFDTEDYNYQLPLRLIAQVPASKRDRSRLLRVNRSKSMLSEHSFFDLPDLLRPGDLLVLNDTRVVPARLFGQKESGGRVEVLVLGRGTSGEDPNVRWCLVKSSKRPKEGSVLRFSSGVTGEVEELAEDGLVKLSFKGDKTVDALMEEEGRMPLPPYIKRGERDIYAQLDRERYQTVFSRCKGAVAAPTAGLHFTENLIERLKEARIEVTYLTLTVGHGTFRPVRVRDIRKHRLGSELFHISPETAATINEHKRQGTRVIAVGTTVVRALEAVSAADGRLYPGEGETDLLITPGFPFRAIDGLITNFHLPKSSLLFLVSAFAGMELIRNAYAFAVDREYRFFSYGDAMLIL